MHLKGQTWIFLMLLKFVVGYKVQMKSFKSNPNFNRILPYPSKAIISSISKTSRPRCAEVCMSERLCEGFLFNSNTAECKLSRCSVQGLKISPDHAGWKYFGNTKACDEGWYQFGDSCYQFSATPRKFNDAVKMCKSTSCGAHLLEICSPEEEKWIASQMRKRDWTSIMLGITDSLHEGSFRFLSTGSKIDGIYSNWYKTQPNGGRRENCAAFQLGFNGWHDYSCNHRIKYICKKTKF